MEENANKAYSQDTKLYPSDPAVIPDPTYWPCSLAFGSTLFLWGLISSVILSVFGIIYIIISIAGWISELNHEK